MASHLEYKFSPDGSRQTVSFGNNPPRLNGAYEERIFAGESGKGSPDQNQEEAVDDEEPLPSGELPRQLFLVVDEEGQLKPLEPNPLFGCVWFGPVFLVAVHFDEASGSSWHTDVTPADVEAARAHFAARLRRGRGGRAP